MARYDLNPKTKLPVRDEESQLNVNAYHGKLHAFLSGLSPLYKVVFRIRKPAGSENVPKKGGVIVASNHHIAIDPFVMTTVIKRPIFFLGKSSLLNTPLIGKRLKSAGLVPIDRAVHNSNASDYAIKKLKDGGLIVMFPEGTCNRGEKLLPFKFGTVSIAQKAGVPIIPTARWKGKTTFGKPMMVGKDLEKANEELRAEISRMRKDLMRKPIKQSDGWLQVITKPLMLALIKFVYKPKIIGKENIPRKGPIIVASNHKHDLDPFLLMAGRPSRRFHFIAKDECMTWKIGRAIGAYGVIFVDRDSDDTTVMKKTVKDFLEKGRAIALFPEGTRNKTPELITAFKMGAVSFANKNNATLIPASIIGWYRPFKKGLTVVFGKPVDVNIKDLTLANDRLHRSIKKTLNDYGEQETRKMIYNHYQDKVKRGK